MFKHHVLICTQSKPPMVPSCGAVGSAEILDLFRKEIFNAGLENDVMVTGTGCIGLCTRGANVVVYPSGKFYTAVKSDEVKKIVEDHLKKGVVVERNDPPEDNLKMEISMFHQRIKAMMQDAGRL